MKIKKAVLYFVGIVILWIAGSLTIYENHGQKTSQSQMVVEYQNAETIQVTQPPIVEWQGYRYDQNGNRLGSVQEEEQRRQEILKEKQDAARRDLEGWRRMKIM